MQRDWCPSGKRSWHGLVMLLRGFANVDDVRNGLLLHKSIEWAFDTSRLVIVRDAEKGARSWRACLTRAFFLRFCRRRLNCC